VLASRWDQAKAVPIDDIAARLGITLPRRGTVRCPFPNHNDKEPSFSIDRSKNLCFCHGCGRGGSAIDFVATVNGCTAAQAVGWILQSFVQRTGPVGYSPRPADGKLGLKLPTGDVSQFSPDTEAYLALLGSCHMTNEGRSYLESRGITASTVAKFDVRYIGNASSVLSDLLDAVGQQRAFQAGLILRGSKSKLVFPSRSILFPFWEKGRVVYLQSRSTDKLAPTRWMGLNRVSKAIYNVDSVGSAKDVYICEGVIDVLSAFELDLVAIGLTGAGVSIPGRILEALRGKAVYVLPDRDQGGNRMAISLMAQLRKARIQAVVQGIPVGNDLNEYLLHVRANP
jgi:DNA primase